MIALAVLAWLFAAATPEQLAAEPAATVHFVGETTDGHRIALPDGEHGRPLVLVVGLSEDAARPTARWSDALGQRLGTRASVVSVAVLDRVPHFVRGWVKHAIDKQLGPPQPGHPPFVTTFDGAALRTLAPAGTDRDPVLYIFDANSRLSTIERTAFSEDALMRVEREIP